MPHLVELLDDVVELRLRIGCGDPIGRRHRRNPNAGSLRSNSLQMTAAVTSSVSRARFWI